MSLILNRIYFLAIGMLFFSFQLQAQSPNGIIRCGHDLRDSLLHSKNNQLDEQRAHFEKLLQQTTKSKHNQKATALSSTEVITIPVVVHVIHDNSFGTIGGPLNSNISDAQIYSQIEVLNEDFRRLNADTTNTPAAFQPVAADSYIEFCMASRDPDGNTTTGITRTFSNLGPFDINDASTLANIISWPTDEYLNIWVCELSGGLLGYAQFPDDSDLDGLASYNGSAETDGVVMNHENFGNQIGTATLPDPYTFGRTCTHEVGHWLGLLHIWGSTGCFGTDHVDDTPNAESENYNCPTGQTSCLSTDMVENYMDYTDDLCMNIFTADQATRMRSVFDVSPRRKAILSSPGCCGAGITYLVPYDDTFESNAWIETLGWDTVTVGNTDGWEHKPYGAYGESSGSIGIDNNSGNNGSIDYLISPVVDFRNTDYPYLEFDFAYSSEGGSSTDSIIIQYENRCDDDWQTLATLSGTDLITSTKTGIPFIPDASDWSRFSMPLNELAGLAVIKFRIIVYSHGVNTFYLDNFNVYKINSNLELTLYPNPADQELRMDISFEGIEDVEVGIYTLLGQKILVENRLATKSRLLKFDTSELNQGLYLARVTVAGKVNTKKFVIEHP